MKESSSFLVSPNELLYFKHKFTVQKLRQSCHSLFRVDMHHFIGTMDAGPPFTELTLTARGTAAMVTGNAWLPTSTLSQLIRSMSVFYGCTRVHLLEHGQVIWRPLMIRVRSNHTIMSYINHASLLIKTGWRADFHDRDSERSVSWARFRCRSGIIVGSPRGCCGRAGFGGNHFLLHY